MLIVIGKTASGKDTIVNKLVSEHGFKKITTYTTRPCREKEIPDVTYHYLSDEDFMQKVDSGFFAEWKIYHTEFGDWYYGSEIDDLNNADDKSIIILTPDGYKDVIKNMNYKPKSIYIYANNPTIKKRLKKRGDSPDEAKRRLEHDNIDFKGIEYEVDKIVYNNDGEDLDVVINKILEYLEK